MFRVVRHDVYMMIINEETNFAIRNITIKAVVFLGQYSKQKINLLPS